MGLAVYLCLVYKMYVDVGLCHAILVCSLCAWLLKTYEGVLCTVTKKVLSHSICLQPNFSGVGFRFHHEDLVFLC